MNIWLLLIARHGSSLQILASFPTAHAERRELHIRHIDLTGWHSTRYLGCLAEDMNSLADISATRYDLSILDTSPSTTSLPTSPPTPTMASSSATSSTTPISGIEFQSASLLPTPSTVSPPNSSSFAAARHALQGQRVSSATPKRSAEPAVNAALANKKMRFDPVILIEDNAPEVISLLSDDEDDDADTKLLSISPRRDIPRQPQRIIPQRPFQHNLTNAVGPSIFSGAFLTKLVGMGYFKGTRVPTRGDTVRLYPDCPSVGDYFLLTLHVCLGSTSTREK